MIKFYYLILLKSAMATKEHQQLVNKLSNILENQGVVITHIDIAGDPQYFDKKYRDLPTPIWYDKHSPDLQGTMNGQIHLGEAEITINNSSVDEHLMTFANVINEQTSEPVFFHVIVPKVLEKELYEKVMVY